MYKHLFFDLDHTLWDFDANSKLSLQKIYDELELKEKGVHDFERFYRSYLHHNNVLWDRYRKKQMKQEELRWRRMWRTLLDFKIGSEKLAREIAVLYLNDLPKRNILFPDTIEVLTYLKEAGYQLHVITNGFDEVQHSKINNSGLTGYFTEVITSQGANCLKPDKEIFEYALQKAGAEPESSIMLGDNIEVDIRGAMNAGLDQVHVNHTREATDVSPTYTVYSLAEIRDILKS